MKKFTIISIALMHITMLSAHNNGFPRETENVNGLQTTEAVVVIDVSRYQGEIDFEQVALSHVKHVIIKATEGSTLTDPKFYQNIAGARDAGIKVGAYHFFSCKSSAQAQATHFLNTIQQVELNLIPVIDVEVCNNYTPSQLVDSLYIMIHRVEEVYGLKPMLYTSESFYRHYLHNHFEGCPLWLAKYNRQAPIDLGAEYLLWQFTDRGEVPGIEENTVDMSLFVNNHQPSEIELTNFNKKHSSKNKKKKQKIE